MPSTDQVNALDYKFTDGHVQDAIFDKGAGYISSESIVLAIKLRNADTGEEDIVSKDDLANFIPVGLVENVTIAQQKQLQQLFEVGSREAYFIPGRTVVQVGINRIIFDGDSLLRVLYPTLGYETQDSDQPASASMTNFNSDLLKVNRPGSSDTHADLWFNLASEFFNKPFTAALVFYNNDEQLRGYVVLEKCYVEAHNLTVVAAQTVVTENVRIRATKVTGYGTD